MGLWQWQEPFGVTRFRPPEPGPPEQAYDSDAVEAKWQACRAERRTNEPDLDRAERPFSTWRPEMQTA
jgi:hypothetical protein